MLVHTLPIPAPLTLTAEPLSPTAFAPFGAVLTNPAPELQPSTQNDAQSLPSGFGAASANQGTAIQYRSLAPPLRNLYASAPSGKPAEPRTTMFVCGTRKLITDGRDGGGENGGLFEVKILERHPFTTQTFVPLGVSASSSTRYLVIVAPSLEADDSSSSVDKDLPVPTGGEAVIGGGKPQNRLPGRGMPDLKRLRAFVATGAQAVTYGAGTWHAPMAALGPAGSAIDFVVVQFANDVPVEDCQEVALGGTEQGQEGGEKGDAPRIIVRVLGRNVGLSKL